MTDDMALSAPVPAYIQSLLLPVHQDFHLLLPNVTVAEIIASATIEEKGLGPPWYLGQISWRGIHIPVADFRRLNEEPEGNEFVGRIAVLNGSCGHANLPFYGLAISAFPRQMRVIADEIAQEGDAPIGPAEACRVRASGELGSIPDLEYIEQCIADLDLPIR